MFSATVLVVSDIMRGEIFYNIESIEAVACVASWVLSPSPSPNSHSISANNNWPRNETDLGSIVFRAA